MTIPVATHEEIKRLTVIYEQGKVKIAVAPVACYNTRQQAIGYIPMIHATLLSGLFLPLVSALRDCADFFQWGTPDEFAKRGLTSAADAMQVWHDATPSEMMEKVVASNGTSDLIKTSAVIRKITPPADEPPIDM